MDDRWAFVAVVTDQELSNELSSEEKVTPKEVPATVKLMTDDELLDELNKLEMDEPWTEEERTAKAPPAKVLTKEDMAQCGYISVRRTWSNTELYRLVLTVQPSQGGTTRKIEAITWERREDHLISAEQAKMDVVLPCRSHLECDLAAAPDDDTLQFSGLL